jgi:O-antigen ligase
MSAKKTESIDYQTLSSTARQGGNVDEPGTLKSLLPASKKQSEKSFDSPLTSLVNSRRSQSPAVAETDFFEKKEQPADSGDNETAPSASAQSSQLQVSAIKPEPIVAKTELSYSEQQKQAKKDKAIAKDYKLLAEDNWLIRNGHSLTYVGLYLFSILVLFRPYDLVPALGFLSATAFYFALATLLIYLPTQFTTEGNITILTTEVKAILALTFVALITIPIAKSPATAWAQFNDPYIKAVIFFLMMINVIRTRRRLMAMVWLSLSIGVLLSYMALGMYMRGEMKVEDYRVGVEIGGMFENPNEFSLHLIMMMPLTLTLAIASRSKLMKLTYFAMMGIMFFANMITYSRGGFLGLIAASAFLAWKLGRKNRILVGAGAFLTMCAMLVLAPNNFGLRILSIFIPALDEAGSSNQRSELLERSILVSIRNPWGIGIGNFPIVGVQNLVSHNAYTQVSSELGVLGLIAYMIFIISPFRKLAAIDRTLYAKDELNWFYYLSIGLQGSFVAYFVGSFFASVAYYWFIYYLVAYAVAFRRIYYLENNLPEEPSTVGLWRKQPI